MKSGMKLVPLNLKSHTEVCDILKGMTLHILKGMTLKSYPEVTAGRVLLVFVCPQSYQACSQSGNGSGWKAPLGSPEQLAAWSQATFTGKSVCTASPVSNGVWLQPAVFPNPF